jgi:hypothetical protein
MGEHLEFGERGLALHEVFVGLLGTAEGEVGFGHLQQAKRLVPPQSVRTEGWQGAAECVDSVVVFAETMAGVSQCGVKVGLVCDIIAFAGQVYAVAGDVLGGRMVADEVVDMREHPESTVSPEPISTSATQAAKQDGPASASSRKALRARAGSAW